MFAAINEHTSFSDFFFFVFNELLKIASKIKILIANSPENHLCPTSRKWIQLSAGAIAKSICIGKKN